MKRGITMDAGGMVCWLLCGMGVVFIGIGIASSFVLPNTGSTPPGDEWILRVAFLGAFGGVGVVLTVIGAIIGARAAGRKRLKKRLCQEGNWAWAEVAQISRSHDVRINGRSPFVLRCQYRHSDGDTYLFKSPYLRCDPRPLLSGDQVKVWFDRDDIRKYYVDVDGSMDGGYIEL